MTRAMSRWTAQETCTSRIATMAEFAKFPPRRRARRRSLRSPTRSGVAPPSPRICGSIKGTNLAPPNDSRIWTAADFVNNQLPAQLDGVSATVNGKPAFIYYISPGQLNILTPPDALSGPVQVQTSVNGVVSNTMTVPAASIAPSFFVFDGVHVVGTHLNGADLGPATLYPGLTTPAKAGETVILYGNGFGPTSVAVVSGSQTQSGNLPAFPVVTIGGSPAVVGFAGLISPGLFQFNVTRS